MLPAAIGHGQTALVAAAMLVFLALAALFVENARRAAEAGEALEEAERKDAGKWQ